MKRFLCLIVSALLIFNTVVLANTNETVEIDVNVKTYTIETTVKTSINSPLTLKVYKLTEENTLGEIVHLWQENTDVENVYTFDAYDVDENAATSMYRALINNKYGADFRVVNINEKGTFYKDVAQKSAEEMETFLSQSVEAGIVDFELGGYFAYPDDVKTSINECLALLELPALSETPTVEELEAFEAVLEPEVARLIKTAELFTAESAIAFEEELEASAEGLGLDMKYYGDDELGLDFNSLRLRLAAFAQNSFDEETVKATFDEASLLAIIDHAGYELITDALKYYDDVCINLDTTKTSGFTETELNNVSKLMKQNAASLKNADDVEDMYVQCAKTVASQGGTSKPSGGAVGGGAGGGGSSIRPNTAASAYPQAESTAAFSDIGNVTWAEESIEYLGKKGVISGKGDGKYYPNDLVTREELVKIIVEAFDVMADGNVDFSDVAKDSWSYSYIAKAYNAGIINGVGENAFSPKSNITRQDMAVIIYRVAKERGITGATRSGFNDNADIADYAKDAVGVLYNAGIINGTGNNKYSPLDPVTRAQAAKVVYELLKSIGGVS